MVPTRDEEESAADANTEGKKKEDRPEQLVEGMEWDKGRALDKYVKEFLNFYVNCWACESMYVLLKDNLQGSLELMMACRASFATIDLSQLPPSSRKAAQLVYSFVTAFGAVAVPEPMDRASYCEYQAVFVGVKGKVIPEFHKLLVLQCRKNVEFKTLEAMIPRSAAIEMESGPQVVTAISELKDAVGRTSAELVNKYVALVVGEWKAMRPGTVKPVVTLLEAAVIKQLTTEPDPDNLKESSSCIKSGILAGEQLCGKSPHGAMGESLKQGRKAVDAMREGFCADVISSAISSGEVEGLYNSGILQELDSLDVGGIAKETSELMVTFAGFLLQQIGILCKTVLDDRVG